MFLYIDPLKQGLKQGNGISRYSGLWFLYIDPLKQGLKPYITAELMSPRFSFYT